MTAESALDVAARIGERHDRLGTAFARAVRDAHKAGYSYRTIGERLNISHTAVARIINRQGATE